ncbi:MAG TPA: AarF/ABC1/UbiB kinase family protein [Rubrobacteraceae bacterium]|nr:AarF/ABC1/UbiB kinase family protein [Rubrobacteraceae bacterium]
MEHDALTRFYAEVAKNLSRSWLEAGSTVFAANRHLTDAVRGWGDEAWAAAEVLTRATRRSGEETRDVFGIAEGAPDAASLARFGDLVRAQTFLWTVANLSAAERLGRAASARGETLPGFAPDFSELVASASSPRVFVLGVVAMDLWVGYAALRERARLMPGLVREEDWELQHRRGAGRVLDAAAALGGTLIKAAQFASSRPDLLPAPYIERLSELQDRVPPQPWSVMEAAVEREIERPIREIFEEFEGEPVASASIAQVHRARLLDGRRVAVKVQYPRVAQLMEADLAALEGIFGAISRLEPSINLQPILDYLRWTLPMELDFRREAQAIADLKNAMSHRDDVLVPEVVEGMNTERLLVMEFVEGVKVTDREGLITAGIDPRRLAELLIEVYAEQLFQRGIFHADPHPGNLFVQPGPNGPVLVLLDHGLTVGVPPELVAAMKEAIEALSEGDFDALTGALQKTGLDLDPDLDLDTLLGLVGVLLGGDRGEEGDGGGTDFGEFGLSLGASIGHIPNDLLLVGRAIGLIDGITRQLDPDLDTINIVARYAQEA